MPVARKVAFVSPSSTAYVHRLVRGALSYSESQSQAVVRDFRIPYQLASTGKPDAIVNQLRAWKPDGLLNFSDTDLLMAVRDSLPGPCPVVSLRMVEIKPGIIVVAASFAAMLQVAVSHFRELGIRSIAFVMLESEEIRPGKPTDIFKRIVRPANPAQATLVHLAPSALREDPQAVVTPVPPRLAAWLRNLPKPVGVFSQDVGGGGYIIRCCHALGLRVPEDVAVIGMDDADLSLASEPTLTSVVAAGETIGFEAMRILESMMQGLPCPDKIVRLDAADLHVRQSTGSRRAEICDIAAAADYINQRACTGLSVAQVLKATQHVSNMTFHTHFKAATGQTPGEAIRRRQFEEARRLLAETELPVTLVAEQSGFGSGSDFARRFRAYEGITPTAYRQRERKARR